MRKFRALWSEGPRRYTQTVPDLEIEFPAINGDKAREKAIAIAVAMLNDPQCWFVKDVTDDPAHIDPDPWIPPRERVGSGTISAQPAPGVHIVVNEEGGIPHIDPAPHLTQSIGEVLRGSLREQQ